MISVIVPLYKGNKFVPQIVERVEEQSSLLYSSCGQKLELILVNDYPDEVIDVPSSDSIDIVFLNHEQNSGIQQARVTGLQVAKGEYIHFIDQDDYVEANFFVELYGVAQATNADVVVSNGYRDYPDHSMPIYKKESAIKLVSDEAMYIYGTDVIFSPGQSIIKKSSIPVKWISNIMHKSGSDDFYLWLLMFGENRVIKWCNQMLYHHIDDGANFSASKEKMNLSFEEMIMLLRQDKILPIKYLQVLDKRLIIKKARTSGSKADVIKILITNPKIFLKTLEYKIKGYY
ncbi:MAG: glycosyltransferase [Saccharofermentans sp.]|nr:glycosyltransferase [Saccharofermentans sp.]